MYTITLHNHFPGYLWNETRWSCSVSQRFEMREKTFRKESVFASILVIYLCWISEWFLSEIRNWVLVNFELVFKLFSLQFAVIIFHKVVFLGKRIWLWLFCFVGLLRALQPVLVSRVDPDSRKNTINEIRKRATSEGQWPQVRHRRWPLIHVKSWLCSFRLARVHPLEVGSFHVKKQWASSTVHAMRCFRLKCPILFYSLNSYYFCVCVFFLLI